MQYRNIIEGKFIKRYKRFIAEVEINGEVEIVHVKNTGRCEELLVVGARVLLEESDNEKRKTKYSLISVYKGDILINMDSQVPNAVVYDAFVNNKIKNIKAENIKREVTYGNSRFDIYFEENGKKSFCEVKGVTLEKNGIAMFPDAKTERGRKHLLELQKASEEGYNAYVVFLIQMKGVSKFIPHKERDEEFYKALKYVSENGVTVMAYDSIVTRDTIKIDKEIEIVI